MTPLDIIGLTDSEVLARRARGQGNTAPQLSSRSYGQIFRENVFTFINLVIFGLGVSLVLLRRYSDAIVSVGVIMINIIVSVVQEIRAKRVLDRIALLTRPTATVLREGQELQVDPAEIVLGDILKLTPGDQVVVDGQLLIAERLEADESLLSGEADPVAKNSGDLVYSGSFCVNGRGYYQAQKVGADNLANQLTSKARAFRRVLTPLQKQLNLVLRVMLLIMFYLLLLLAIQSFYRHLPLVDSVRMAVVIAGLVPNGLFLAIAVAYALGAVRIAGKGALVQQSNAVESLSNVDMLCLDKTGTLTANRLQLNELCPLQASQEELKRLLGDFAASIPSGNRTNAAIAAAFPGSKHEFIEEVPFSSEWKWSALTYDKPEEGQTFILGAPEIVATALQKDGAGLQAINSQVHNWARQGLRIVLFSRAPDGIDLYDADNHPQLPENLVPLGLVSLRDELRPEARQTLAAFAQSGVEVKIISGDNPDTVAALAIQAGLDQNLKTLSGRELSQLNGAQLVTAIEETRVFGRITPQQKNLILRTLREQGHYVAMVGDGVNDLLALKESNLGIAMQSGSQATRAVSDIVLLNDSFASLPYAVREGQRIIVGMQDILKLFMTRILFAALLILSTSVIGGFPFAPKHNSILTLFIVGIPTLALAYWAQPGVVRYHVMTRRLFHFVLPAGLTLSVATLGVFLYYMLPVAYSTVTQTARAATMLTAQTMVTQLSIFCGLLLVIFVEPPIRFLVGGDRLSNDWRPTWLAFGLLLVYIIVVSTPQIRRFFELVPLTFYDYAILACIAVAWAFLLRWIWRSRVLDRFLSVDFDLQETKAETALDIKESEE